MSEQATTIRTRGLVRGKYTISVVDYENHPGLRDMIARSPEWRWNEYVMAWVRHAAIDAAKDKGAINEQAAYGRYSQILRDMRLAVQRGDISEAKRLADESLTLESAVS